MKSNLFQIKLLKEVIKFNALKILAYPWEWVAFFFQRFISLSFLALFWFAVAKSSSVAVSFRELIAYFLVAGAVRDLVFANDTKFGRSIMLMIKSGEISNYLVKPVSIIPFLFSTFAGQTWMAIVYAIVTLIAGLIILPPAGIINILFFVIFLIFAFCISLSFNLFVAIVSFYIIEANGIRNMFNHVTRILSGTLIPLTLFPPALKWIIMLTPFPIVAFTPAYVLQNNLVLSELTSLFIVSLVWAVGLLIFILMFWRRSLRRYEGVGI